MFRSENGKLFFMTTAIRPAGWVLGFAVFVSLTFYARSALASETVPESDWEQVVKAAELEGEVVYSASGSHRLLEEFHRTFPKIKTTSVSASCSQIVARIMTERRAGKHLADERLDNEDIGTIWERHYPKRAENAFSMSLCLTLVMIIRLRAGGMAQHTESSDKLQHALAAARVPKEQFDRLESESKSY
jgi:hypothetical protein